MTLNTDNYTVGGIDLYFAPTVAHASLRAIPTGGGYVGSPFRNKGHSLGNIVTAEIAADVTYLEHFISENGRRRRNLVVANTESISIPFTFDEINENNLQRALLASNLGSGKLAVLQETVQRGSFSLYFKSQVGDDLVWSIPKGCIRPDGNLSIGDGTDWWSQPMVIDVEYYATKLATTTWKVSPYGIIDTTPNSSSSSESSSSSSSSESSSSSS